MSRENESWNGHICDGVCNFKRRCYRQAGEFNSVWDDHSLYGIIVLLGRESLGLRLDPSSRFLSLLSYPNSFILLCL